ncbi:hypothetical protein GCM10007886_31040 [Methylobacterium gregans]|nr:hypothetical protein GCM10007886_31040 [Methylobacterium gregans]
MTDAPDGDLKFQAAVVITQLRARNTGSASCVETDDGVAGRGCFCLSSEAANLHDYAEWD